MGYFISGKIVLNNTIKEKFDKKFVSYTGRKMGIYNQNCQFDQLFVLYAGRMVILTNYLFGFALKGRFFCFFVF